MLCFAAKRVELRHASVTARESHCSWRGVALGQGLWEHLAVANVLRERKEYWIGERAIESMRTSVATAHGV